MFDDLRDRLDNMSVSSTPQQSEYSFRGNLNDISLPDHTISPPVATSTPLRQSTSHIPLQFSASSAILMSLHATLTDFTGRSHE